MQGQHRPFYRVCHFHVDGTLEGGHGCSEAARALWRCPATAQRPQAERRCGCGMEREIRDGGLDRAHRSVRYWRPTARQLCTARWSDGASPWEPLEFSPAWPTVSTQGAVKRCSKSSRDGKSFGAARATVQQAAAGAAAGAAGQAAQLSWSLAARPWAAPRHRRTASPAAAPMPAVRAGVLLRCLFDASCLRGRRRGGRGGAKGEDWCRRWGRLRSPPGPLACLQA